MGIGREAYCCVEEPIAGGVPVPEKTMRDDAKYLKNEDIFGWGRAFFTLTCRHALPLLIGLFQHQECEVR